MKRIIIKSKKYGRKIATVDDSDFDKVKHITWTLQKHLNGFIVCGWHDGRTVKLHRFILNIHRKQHSKIRLIHIDGDNFNNQKSNLKIVEPPRYITSKHHVELVIESTDGLMKVLFDHCDYNLIKNYTWRIVRTRRSNIYYVASFKNEGDYYSSVLMHRLILKFPSKLIDHKNRNGLDNRRCNLRLATSSQNRMNSIKHIGNYSGFKGVHKQSKANTFFARVTANGLKIHGGTFKSKVDAAKRYNELAVKHHGKFARLNPIPS